MERKLFIGLICLLLLPASSFARMAPSSQSSKHYSGLAAQEPSHCYAGHDIGKIVLGVANNGTFGKGFIATQGNDCFTGDPVPSCEYPKASTLEYLFAGAFWIGAVKGRDTLVSVGADGWQFTRELFPDIEPFGDMEFRSIIDPAAPEFAGAISEQDYIAVYSDTITEGVDPDFFGRPHKPLNIEVTQRSFAWSYSYAEDFVLFDYAIKNIGRELLERVYMGVYVDADVGFNCFNEGGNCAQDDLCGFVRSLPSQFECGSRDFLDTVNIAWTADADGDFEGGTGGEPNPVTSLTATRIVRTPADSLEVSFNWWVSNVNAALDYGPREHTKNRDFRTGGLGTPEGDVNKYFLLSNNEFDFDQAYTATIQPTDPLWAFPPQDRVDEWATGLDTRYLLSFGPFDIAPGQTLPISFAYVAGEDFHSDRENAPTNLPDNPDAYYDNLDFTDLGVNANWASWIYDNPGVDTDNDGFSGKMRFCPVDSAVASVDTAIDTTVIPPDTTVDSTFNFTKIDTIFYEGDGVPDFQGATPPPAPEFWLNSQDPTLPPGTKFDPGTIRIRFNGTKSETTPDVFSGDTDFEGYRIYLGRDAREGSYSLLESYDIKDFNKFVFTGAPGFELLETPFTLQELRCLYGESCGDESFDPLEYTLNDPFRHPDFPDSIFFFEPQDFNVSELGIETEIVKRFPDQPYPSSLIPDSADESELTEDGYLKYFEYEYIIRDLLPTVPYWVSITAFDFGSPQSGLPSLETAKTLNTKAIYADGAFRDSPGRELQVYVYPNPYRIDQDYRDQGYEGRNFDENRSLRGRPAQGRPDDRVRQINFANLPPKCTIRIFTIDGDLVREIEHDEPPGSSKASHDYWNMITRNTQLVVSGLYYWSVEAADGRTQIGKLVIIM